MWAPRKPSPVPGYRIAQTDEDMSETSDRSPDRFHPPSRLRSDRVRTPHSPLNSQASHLARLSVRAGGPSMASAIRTASRYSAVRRASTATGRTTPCVGYSANTRSISVSVSQASAFATATSRTLCGCHTPFSGGSPVNTSDADGGEVSRRLCATPRQSRPERNTSRPSGSTSRSHSSRSSLARAQPTFEQNCVGVTSTGADRIRSSLASSRSYSKANSRRRLTVSGTSGSASALCR